MEHLKKKEKGVYKVKGTKVEEAIVEAIALSKERKRHITLDSEGIRVVVNKNSCPKKTYLEWVKERLEKMEQEDRNNSIKRMLEEKYSKEKEAEGEKVFLSHPLKASPY
jgi:hypothetical protein